ncbi:hypothetical protein ACFE04_021196 [Oxalis oulophora]
MAVTNSKGAQGIFSLAKQVVEISSQIWRKTSSSSTTHLTPLIIRRAAHSSAYDKNLDEHVRQTIVPDHVINDTQSDKYWAPHPQTGVFSPVADHQGFPIGDQAANGGQSLALEEKAWFRPTSLEDLEKPHHT